MEMARGNIRFSEKLVKALSWMKPYWADRRVRLLSGVAMLALAVAWYWFGVASATLTVAGRHGFRQAAVSIWVDGDLRTTFEVSGSAKKKLGLFQKVDGTFARSIRVAAGTHIVRVRVRSLTDNNDIIRECRANTEAGTESTVYVNADRGLLALSLASSSSAPKSEPGESGGYLKMMQSIFMAIAGSALSATVGFLVQDFLKSRKQSTTQAQSAQ